MEWPFYVSLILIFILVIVLCVALWHQTGKTRTRQRVKPLDAVGQRKLNEQKYKARYKLNKSKYQTRKAQRQVDDKVDREVKRLYAQYGEEWINNAGRSRLAMAIDEMLGPAPRRDSNAARAQRTLASAILETVLERKGETVRQQQAASGEDSQGGIVVDPMLAVDIVDTAEALAADVNYTNDLDGADDVDDFDADDLDHIDDIDDIDADVDLDLD